jgi:hypothetical protein
MILSNGSLTIAAGRTGKKSCLHPAELLLKNHVRH